MRIQSFEDVIAWQKAKELYILSKDSFASLKEFSYKDQYFRATLSISNNIAEGFDRGSDKELRYFLLVSRGSCAEVRSMLHIAKEANYLTVEQYDNLVQLTQEISKLLTGFIKKLATEDWQLETPQ